VHGKIDRRALPEPEWTGGSVAFVAPANDTETKLAALYREVLGLERVGTQHNFFEMGGDSISATRLVSRIRVEFGNEFPLRTFFESSDILTLATRLTAMTAPTTVPLGIKPATRLLVFASGSGGRA
jgi:acyl carrier protein